MPTFIDESGDIGWEVESEKFFRLGAVWVPSETVEVLRQSIQQLRGDLHLSSDYEFKFAKTRKQPKRRRAFFSTALKSEFRFVVCSYDKNRLKRRPVKEKELYSVCSDVLATQLRDTYDKAEKALGSKGGKPNLLRALVIVDDNGDKAFLRAIRKSFRALGSDQKEGVSLVSKVKFRDSKRDELMQLIDMIIGAVGLHLDGKDSEWYEMIRERILGQVVTLP